MFPPGAVQDVLDCQLRLNCAAAFQELSFVISINSYAVVLCFICSGYIIICHCIYVICWSLIQYKDFLPVYGIGVRRSSNRVIYTCNSPNTPTPTPPHPHILVSFHWDCKKGISCKRNNQQKSDARQNTKRIHRLDISYHILHQLWSVKIHRQTSSRINKNIYL